MKFDLSLEPPVLFRDPFETVAKCGSVSVLLQRRCRSEVGPPIVLLVEVAMIDACSPRPGHESVSKLMGEIRTAAYHDADIATPIHPANNIANLDVTIRDRDKSAEQSGLWIVRENCPKFING